MNSRLKERRAFPRIYLKCPFDFITCEKHITLNKSALIAKFLGIKNRPYFQLASACFTMDSSPSYNHCQFMPKIQPKKHFQMLIEELFPNVLPLPSTISLSQGGLSIFQETNLELNQSLYIMLKLDSHPVPLFLKGRIIECTRLNQHRLKRTVIQFDEPQGTEAWLINRHVIHQIPSTDIAVESNSR